LNLDPTDTNEKKVEEAEGEEEKGTMVSKSLSIVISIQRMKMEQQKNLSH
jgi:hypothetical protein